MKPRLVLFLVSSKPATSNSTTLVFSGQFQPKIIEGRPPVMFRPGQVPLLASLTRFSGPYPREVIIDHQGRALQVSSESPLPVPLGTLSSLLFPELPGESSEKWEHSTTAYVMDDPVLQGPATVFGMNPYMGGSMHLYSPGSPGRQYPAYLAVSHTTRYSIEQDAEKGTSLKGTVALDSLLKTRDEPRISSSGEMRYVFDREAGLPRSAQWETRTLVSTENFARRITLKCTVKRLEGEALEKALQPPRPVEPQTPPTPLSSQEVEELVKKMNSSDPAARMNAANELNSKTVEKLEDAVLDKLVFLASDREDFVRRAALKTLAAHPRSRDLPVLVRGIAAQQDPTLRRPLVDGIAGLKSSDAASALAELIVAGTEHYNGSSQPSEVAQALIKMGPLAEAAALPLAREKNVQTLVDASRVLREIGTDRSVSSLQRLVAHPSKDVSEEAAAAIRTIQARQEVSRKR